MIKLINKIPWIFLDWFENENAKNARERLMNGKDIKIIYDEPWFWKISASRN